MKLLRLLLLPLSFLYGIVLSIRHYLYDKGGFKSVFFDGKVIVIGNLIVGGAGKSPMTEYLIRLLSKKYHVATLSRGYGRRTKGFFLVDIESLAANVGDEPLQFKRKFPQLTVAVCENRVDGVKELLKNHQVVLLDDAYQHRSLKPGISILLFDYPSLYNHKLLLPAGNYRDLFSRRNNADIIVITKSPEKLTVEDKQSAINMLRLEKYKPIYFSYLVYGQLIGLLDNNATELLDLKPRMTVLTGIANPTPFIAYLQSKGEVVQTHVYPDHYRFTKKDIVYVTRKAADCDEQTIIVTTEKDAMRLLDPKLITLLSNIPIYYLPVEVAFHSQESFDKSVMNYIANIGNE
ncbi:tetraacyldisaccharide 4'-kinase [Olivibacter sp. SDN3]|uniref:tetraacyldisaccharide 4'-kinase n=1 Tax=Olivibacter sp. SDN3 TaxID=2764720 RepID=UPI00165198AA|nr:tetraacyldisaccharide 4'-kinase [Olivibacter sp. SDN3]QNL50384.1 tetraacyldisaccharide 4'-kinase [Olivibacter sp. SDN3]